MDNSLTLRVGTFGGFALSVIPNITSADVVKTIVLADNYGYAGGYNKAIPGIEEEIIVLLNSDIEPE